MKNQLQAFSLVEVVIALGIFSFCAVGIVGLIPIALDATRTVSQESNANNIAESINGIWQVAPTNSTTPVNLPLGGNGSLGSFTIGRQSTDTQEIYYDNDGRMVADSSAASLKLNYTASPWVGNNSFTVNLTFSWPANAPEDSPTVNRRFFNYIFTK